MFRSPLPSTFWIPGLLDYYYASFPNAQRTFQLVFPFLRWPLFQRTDSSPSWILCENYTSQVYDYSFVNWQISYKTRDKKRYRRKSLISQIRIFFVRDATNVANWQSILFLIGKIYISSERQKQGAAINYPIIRLR